ncbi:MAG: beta strand repeat-containing protein, partial [Candidatus Kapaibacterium sp.]
MKMSRRFLLRSFLPVLGALSVLGMGNMSSLLAQGTRTEQGIRLIHPSAPTAGISLIPPTGITSYSLTLPASQSQLGTSSLLVNNGTGLLTWTTASSFIGNNAWGLLGNSNTDSTTAFIGTTDETPGRPLVFKTDGVERMRINGQQGLIGIGTSTPSSQLSITSSNSNAVSIGGNLTTADLQWSTLANERVVLLSGANGANGYATLTLVSNNTEASGQTLGNIMFGQTVSGKSGSIAGLKASISAASSGTGGTVGGFGGEMVFFTRSDNAVSLTERMRITSSGNVGIGDASPAALFTVGNGDLFQVNSSGNVLIGDVTTGSTKSLTFGNSGSGFGAMLVKNATANSQIFDFYYGRHTNQNGSSLRFWRDQAKQVAVLTGNGDFGLGSTAPSQRLHVAGGNVLIDTSAASTAGQLQLMNPARTFQTNIQAGAQSANITYTLPTTAPTAGQLLSSDASGNMSWANPSAASWTLTGNGSTNPSTNYIGTSDAVDFVIRTTGTERMRVTSGGNVGIGIASPQASLDVARGNTDSGYDQGEQAIIIRNNVTTANGRMGLRFTSGTGATGLAQIDLLNGATTTQGILSFGTRNAAGTIAERMRIAASGEVGIGTTSPSQRLQVSGGNVLIDTSAASTAGQLQLMNPARTFQTNIQSGAQATNITYTLPTAAPSADGQVLTATTGGAMSWSTALTGTTGWSTAGNNLATVTATLGSAPSGPFLGTTTGNTQALQISMNNVVQAIMSSAGVLSLNKDMLVNGVTVGTGAGSISSNVAVGVSALSANTSGSQNTSIGLRTLLSNTSGSQNTAVGREALQSNTTGGQNTASGVSALTSNTTGVQNTASGVNALRSSTVGNYNTAIGVSAMHSNTTGNQNEASGSNALYSNTTGSNNTASGFAALYGNTIGDNNTAVGLDAGRYTISSTALTSASSSVFIGNDTRALADGDANSIIIGSGARGLGSNSAVLGNSSITATRLQGRVGVGADPTVAAGDAQLQVTAAAAANRGLVVKGAASQTANLFEAQNNSGTAQFSIGSSGATTVGGALTLSSVASSSAADSVLLINSSGVVTRSTRIALASSSAWTLSGNASTNASTNYIGTSDAVDFVTRTSGTERMRVTSAGNVGIGTTTPGTDRLYVDGASSVANSTDFSSINILTLGRPVLPAVSYAQKAMFALSRYENGGVGTLGARTRLDIRLRAEQSDETQVMTLRSDGRVGIGNTAPGYLLDVNGTMGVTGNATFSGNVGMGTTPLTERAAVWGTTSVSNATDFTPHNVFSIGRPFLANVSYDQKAIFALRRWENGPSFAARSQLDLKLRNVQTDEVDVMSFLSSGNVGVGTTSPSQRFQVSGGNVLIDTSAASTAGQLQFMNPARTFQTNIRAGAQTANITYTLPTAAPTAGQVLTSDASGNMSWAAASATSWGLTGNAGTSATTNFIGTTDAVDFVARTNNIERMRIVSGGRIEIPGTIRMTGTAPSTLFQINGETTTTGLPSADGYNIRYDNDLFGSTIDGLLFEKTDFGESTVDGGVMFANRSTTGTRTVAMSIRGRNGLVGIGIADPTNAVQIDQGTGVASYAQFTAGTTTGVTSNDGAVLGIDASGNAWMNQRENLSLIFATNNTERMRIENGGSVVIGNGSASSIPSTGILEGTDGSGTNIAGAELRLQGGQGTGTGSGGALTFYTSASGSAGTTTNTASERMRITGAGNVGIGLSAPKTRLQISNGILTVDNAFSYDANALLIAHPTPTSNTALNDPQTVLYLVREGTNGQAYAAGVEMSLSRYSAAGVSSNTRYDISLANSTFLSSKTTVMTMLSSGNVGINKTAPTQALDVNGNVLVNRRISIGASSGVTKLSIGNGFSDGTYTAYVGDTNAIFVTHPVPTSTTALNDPLPVLVLHRDGTSGQSFGAGALFNISRYENNSTNSRTRMDIDLADGVSFSQKRTVITYLSSGNIGVGTIAPSQRLHVSGGNILIDTSAASTAGQLQLMNPARTFQTNIRAGAQTANITYTLPTAAPTAGQVLTSDASGNMSWATATSTSWGLTGNASTNPSTNYLGTSDAQPLVIRTAAIERVRVVASGNVGIGTNNPLNNLHVSGAAAIGAGYVTYYWQPSAGDKVLQLSSQTTPTTGTGSVIILGGRFSSGSNDVTTWASIAGLKENSTNGDGDGYLAFFTAKESQAGSFERMRVTSAGNVGIGTTTPGSVLQVNGGAAIGYSASTAAPANGLIVSGATTIGGALTLSTTATGSSSDQVLVIDGSNAVKKIT